MRVETDCQNRNSSQPRYLARSMPSEVSPEDGLDIPSYTRSSSAQVEKCLAVADEVDLATKLSELCDVAGLEEAGMALQSQRSLHCVQMLVWHIRSRRDNQDMAVGRSWLGVICRAHCCAVEVVGSPMG